MKNYEETIANAHKAFVNHVAKITDLGEIKILDWARPNMRESSIQYTILQDRHLAVTGDYYNAIYTWDGRVNFYALAGYNLGYLYSKINCLTICDLHDWDEDEAVEDLKYHLDNYSGLDNDRKEEILESASHCSDEHEWTEFCRQHSCEVGDDECSLYSAGNVIPYQVIYHHEGLKLAMAQIEKMEAKA